LTYLSAAKTSCKCWTERTLKVSAFVREVILAMQFPQRVNAILKMLSILSA